jgi:hypothetical protein
MAKYLLSSLEEGLGERFAANSLPCTPCLKMYDTTPLLKGVDESFVDIRKSFFSFLFSSTK